MAHPTATDAPQVLYHYTDARGMLGILESGVIWATHAEFMNDTEETKLGFEVAKRALYADNEAEADLLEIPMGKMGEWRDYDAVFVCSFSRRRDSLAMWRGYAAAKGFAIGFRTEFIREIAKKQRRLPALRFVLDEVTHDEEVLLARGRGLVAAFVERGVRDQQLCGHLLRLSAFLKDSAWSEEEEWRLAGVQMNYMPEQVRFRSSGLGLVPYIELHLVENAADGLPDWKTVDAISEIWIGPGHDPNQATALNWMLNRLGIQCEVRWSGVPLRQ